MSYAIEEELLMLIPGLISGIPSGLFRIVTYVLSSLAIYTISCRRGLKKPWLAWIPVLNVWLLGSLSDQYQYIVRGENRSKRTWLLILNILMFVLGAVIVVLVCVVGGMTIFGGYRYGSELLSRLWGPFVSLIGLCLPLAGVAIAYTVIRYMALYDVFKSLDPENSVLFLVLSILFRPTEPFFLFFNRGKDNGMPPRRQESAYVPPQEPVHEPWESEDKDYL